MVEQERRHRDSGAKKLNIREGRNKLFRVASRLRKDGEDVQGNNLKKHEEGNIVVEKTAVTDRSKTYLEQLLKVKIHMDVLPPVESPVDDITEFELLLWKGDHCPLPFTHATPLSMHSFF